VRAGRKRRRCAPVAAPPCATVCGTPPALEYRLTGWPNCSSSNSPRPAVICSPSREVRDFKAANHRAQVAAFRRRRSPALHAGSQPKAERRRGSSALVEERAHRRRSRDLDCLLGVRFRNTIAPWTSTRRRAGTTSLTRTSNTGPRTRLQSMTRTMTPVCTSARQRRRDA
jgi:hypothetical protein